MDEPLRLEYACTPEELKQAQELQFTAQVGRGSKWRAVAALVMLFGIMGMVLFLRFRAMPAAGLPYLLLVIVAIIALLIVVQFFRRKQSSKEGDDELKCLLEITPREVRLAGPTGWAIVPWSGFRKLVESETLFVLPDASGYQLLVFPKRVFPDEQSCTWFREQAQRAGATSDVSPATEVQESLASEAQPGGVQVKVLLGLFDYLDRMFASWKVRGIMIAIGTLMLGTFVVAMMKPAPNAVFSDVEVFFYFCIPALVVLELVIFFTLAVSTWMQHRRLLKLQVIDVTDTGLAFSQSDGRGKADWSDSVRYKETPWSFLIWWPATGVWFQLPKRAFTTHDGVDRCQHILARHVTRSNWYFG